MDLTEGFLCAVGSSDLLSWAAGLSSEFGTCGHQPVRCPHKLGGREEVRQGTKRLGHISPQNPHD